MTGESMPSSRGTWRDDLPPAAFDKVWGFGIRVRENAEMVAVDFQRTMTPGAILLGLVGLVVMVVVVETLAWGLRNQGGDDLVFRVGGHAFVALIAALIFLGDPLLRRQLPQDPLLEVPAGNACVRVGSKTIDLPSIRCVESVSCWSRGEGSQKTSRPVNQIVLRIVDENGVETRCAVVTTRTASSRTASEAAELIGKRLGVPVEHVRPRPSLRPRTRDVQGWP